ncbi:MAG: hypothetical protein AAGD01_12520 [Acidobacteriota bacterium]
MSAAASNGDAVDAALILYLEAAAADGASGSNSATGTTQTAPEDEPTDHGPYINPDGLSADPGPN